MRYKLALVKELGKNFHLGKTNADLGIPNYELAVRQHNDYCRALMRSGVYLLRLPTDESNPDSCFVEDTAVITDYGAIITRPGEISRLGEEKIMERVLEIYTPIIDHITEPGRLDGGDVIRADNHYFIGLSRRTNEDGALQLQDILERYGYTSSTINVPKDNLSILHLITGSSYIGGKIFISRPEFTDEYRKLGYKVIEVPEEEKNAANLVLSGDHLLIPYNCPKTKDKLIDLDRYWIVELATSEFRKQDGDLTCLSIRIPKLKYK